MEEQKEKLNIYQKIQKIKLEISNKKLKKSGKNNYSGFTYYELQDFLPSIVELCETYNLFTKFELGSDKAVLKIINAENLEEEITYTMPTADLEIKGANKIQSIGGVQTYLRRYLYMNAFDIVESDTLDRGNIEVELPISKETDKDKQNENKELIIQYKDLLFKTDTSEEKIIEYFKVKNFIDMTQTQLKEAIEILKKKPIVNIKNEGDMF